MGEQDQKGWKKHDLVTAGTMAGSRWSDRYPPVSGVRVAFGDHAPIFTFAPFA